MRKGIDLMTHEDDHDLGLQHDLKVILNRRALLGGIAATGGLAAFSQLPFVGGAHSDERAMIGVGQDGKECVVQPYGTAGPFPADGSNRAHGTLANVLDDSGIVRGDIRGDIGGGADTNAPGATLDLEFQIVDVAASCKPLPGYVMYLWHCDADGLYSLYQVRGRTYHRGVQVADSQGRVKFTTIMPGCYRGRYPHFHFEIYPSIEKAVDYRTRLMTSQLAIPEDAFLGIYNKSADYRQSRENYAATPSLKQDFIFASNSAREREAQTLVMGNSAGRMRGSVVIGVSL